MTPAQIDAVIAGLTRAQRRAILWMNADGSPEEHTSGDPREVSFWTIRSKVVGDPAREVAKTYSLCVCSDGPKPPGRFWPATMWALTPLGLAVRQRLVEMPLATTTR